jgi:hypothetical protein
MNDNSPYAQLERGLEREIAQLRADLERAQDGWRKDRERAENALDRCTALERERDEAIRAGNVTAALLAETRAALEEAERVYAEVTQQWVEVRGEADRLRCSLDDAGIVLGANHRAYDALLIERDSARAERDQLAEQWAVRELQDTPGPWPEHWLTELPAPVARLVQAGAGLAVGKCDRCGETRPLVNDGVLMVCAPGFGCSKREKGAEK